MAPLLVLLLAFPAPAMSETLDSAMAAAEAFAARPRTEAARVNARARRIDVAAARALKRGGPGLALAVIEKGVVIHKAGYGWADIEGKVPMSPDMVTDLASCSKQFTAAAVLLLEQRGALSLEDDARRFLPELVNVDPKRPIKIADLLRMVSGLVDYTDLIGEDGDYAGMTNASVLALAAGKPLEYPTGSEYKYSNTAYSLLALVVERAAKRPFPEFMRAEIFEKLGMRNTALLETADQAFWRRPKGYKAAGKTWALDRNDAPGMYGDGDVFSSVDDLILWVRAIETGALLPAAAWARAMTSGALDSGKLTGYGFGWEVSRDKAGRRVAEHTGGWSGTATYIGLHLDRGVSIIVLANDADFDVARFAKIVASAASK